MTEPISGEGFAQRAFALRDGLAAAASSMEEREATGSSGGVSVTLTASGALRSISIDPKMMHDPAGLRRHIVLAHQQAHQAIRRMAEEMLSPLRDLVNQTTRGLAGNG